LKALGKRDYGTGPPERKRSRSFEQWLDCPAKLRPELDLTGYRALGDLCRQSGIQDQLIRDLHGLTHRAMVAFCYPVGKRIATCALTGWIRTVGPAWLSYKPEARLD
jgi:hypothetical protein